MPDYISGELLLINKPLYWTSFELVKRIKYEIQKKLNVKKLKVGHAGTLDPLATGLMIICTGKSTKQIEKYQNLPKEYITKIKLGSTTPSFDLETEIDKVFSVDHLTDSMIADTINSFKGTYHQIPPVFSAKSIGGKRAYEHARKGKEINMSPSVVTVYEITLIKYIKPILEIKVLCSKGTYIRALARDIGIRLNSGAHLIELKRSAIGEFKSDNALSFNDFKNYLSFL